MSAALGESKGGGGYMFPSGMILFSPFMPSLPLISNSSDSNINPYYSVLHHLTSLPCSLLDFCISFTLNCPTDYVYPSDRDDAAQDTAATDGGMACTIFLYFCIFQWLLLSLSE